MDQQEVLIHVTAPSRLRDDKRYQSLANKLMRFEIAAMTRVYGFVGLASSRSNDNESNNTTLHFYATTMQEPAYLGRAPRSGKVLADFPDEELTTASSEATGLIRLATVTEAAVPSNHVHRLHEFGSLESLIDDTSFSCSEREASSDVDSDQPRLKPKRRGRWAVFHGEEPARFTHTTQWIPNPPCRNPFRGDNSQPLKTPEAIRPRTAPAGGVGVQVPHTTTPAHKRSASDSFLDGSFTTTETVSDSQPSPAAALKTTYGSPKQFGQQRLTTERPGIYFRVRDSNSARKTKRRRLEGMEHAEGLLKGAAEVHTTPPLNESSFVRRFLVRPPPGCKGPYFLRDQSEDWTSAPEPSSTTSSSKAVSSTLSPSQPLALRLSQTRTAPASAQASQPVILVSDSPPVVRKIRGVTSATRQPSSPSWRGPSSSPRLPSDLLASSPQSATQEPYGHKKVSIGSPKGRGDRASSSVSTKSSRRYDFTSSIRSLPDQIQAPPPPVGSGPFESHVSAGLSFVVSRLPLAKYFRPVQVARNVQILERGHWAIRVKIASDEDVAEARREYNQNEVLAALNKQMLGASPDERQARYEAWRASSNDTSLLGLCKRCDLWTEAEFLCFWKVLTEFICDGKAGHGVSVAKDWPDAAVTPGCSTQSTYSRIRVYTWGEVVGHMWIMLWVLSDKKTAYIPMEWIAADESVVVKMSGNRHRGGKLGAWVPKGSPRGMGSWGVDAGTPPGNQGKYFYQPSS